MRLLAARIAAGDTSAETDFVRIFRPGVLMLVRRHSRPFDADIEDMAQDVMQSTITALRTGRLRDSDVLPAYLRSTVAFTVRSHYRKQHRRGEDRVVLVDDSFEVDDDPLDNLKGHQLAGLLRKLIGELEIERDRRLMEHFYLREQSKEEVCAELGINEDHFHRVTYRARERLRDLLHNAGITTSPWDK
ncbi:MAG: sigma-70 family RNA polymerase sigma factor [Dokdonella sp.]